MAENKCPHCDSNIEDFVDEEWDGNVTKPFYIKCPDCGERVYVVPAVIFDCYMNEALEE